MKNLILTLIAFIALSSIVFANDLELVWEKRVEYAQLHPFGVSAFSFDLASSPDKILSVSTFLFNPPIMDSTRLNLFEIDINTGNTSVVYNVVNPRFLSPKIIKKYNDTLILYNHFDPSHMFGSVTFELRTIKAKFDKYGGGFIINPAYYRDVIDTSVKGWRYTDDMTGCLHGNFLYHNRGCGLVHRYIDKKNGNFYFEKVNTTDTLTFDTLNSGCLLDDIDIDKTNLELYIARMFDLDSNNHLFVTNLITLSEGGAAILKRHGLLFVNFDDEGKIISKKFIQTGAAFYNINYCGDNIITMGSNHSIKEFTLDGNLVKTSYLDYGQSPILSKYSNKEYLASSRYITEDKELYIYGGNSNNDDGYLNYSFYIAKYDSNMTLLYEKEWKFEDYDDCSIENILVKDGFLYVKGIIRGIINNSDMDVYIAKFKEPEVGISEPQILSNSQIFPNPTSDFTTISLDLLESGNIKIELCDLFGRTVKQIYEGFADEGKFEKKVSLTHLSKGIYYLKFQIGKDYKVEKVVVN